MDGEQGGERALRAARRAATLLLVAPLVLAAVAFAVPLEPGIGSLTAPAAFAGLVAPALGYHLYRKMQEAVGEDRPARFVRATILALACTEAAATLGIVAFLLSRRPVSLIGVVLHVFLAGAVWPSRDRFDSFLAGPDGTGP